MAEVRESRESVSVFELGQRLDRQEFDAYLRSLDDALARERPFAMVVDGSDPDLVLVDPPNKRWQVKRALAIGQFHRGVAFVTGSMTRERVQALYALQPPGVPYAFFGERHEALAWARQALDGERRSKANSRKTVPLMAAVRR